MNDHKESDETTDHSENQATVSPRADGARRQVLNAGAVGAAAALLGLVAAACSSDGDDTTATGGTSATGGKSGTGGKGGASATGGGAGASGADTTGTEGGAGGTAGTAGEGGAAGAASVDADITPLNALLSAEYNAITAYSAGAGLIGNAKPADPLYALRATITGIAGAIQMDHMLHAAALVSAIESLKGTPVLQATVAAKFMAPAGLVSNPTITNVLKFAAAAERGAAVAYNQVIAGLEDAQLRFLASSIEGDETQHFIVLTALVLGLASPGVNLSEATATKVIPTPFVSTVGTQKGLDTSSAVPDFFA